MAGNFNSALYDFNKKYNTNLSEDRLYTINRKLDAVNNFLFEKNQFTSDKNNYVVMLLTAFADCVKNNTKFGTDFSVGKFYVNTNEFIQDFEQLISQRASEKKIKRNEYDGNKLENLQKRIKTAITNLNVPLSKKWEAQILNGELTIEEISKQTTDMTNDLIGDKIILETTFKNTVNSFVAIKDAMTNVRNNRGFFWVLFHPIQNYREKKLLEKLNEQGDSIQEKCDITLETYRTSYLGKGILNDQLESYNKIISQDVKNVIVKPNYLTRYKEIIQKENFADQLYKEIGGVLKDGKDSRFPLNSQKLLFSQGMGSSLLQDIQTLCAHNDSIYSKREEKDIYPDNAKELFKNAFKITGNLNYSDLKDRIVVAQKIADILMKTFFTDSKEYEGYVLNNEGMIKEQLSWAEELDINDEINSAKQEYNESKKERVIVEDVKEVAQPVSQMIEQNNDEKVVERKLD